MKFFFKKNIRNKDGRDELDGWISSGTLSGRTKELNAYASVGYHPVRFRILRGLAASTDNPHFVLGRDAVVLVPTIWVEYSGFGRPERTYIYPYFKLEVEHLGDFVIRDLLAETEPLRGNGEHAVVSSSKFRKALIRVAKRYGVMQYGRQIYTGGFGTGGRARYITINEAAVSRRLGNEV